MSSPNHVAMVREEYDEVLISLMDSEGCSNDPDLVRDRNIARKEAEDKDRLLPLNEFLARALKPAG